MRTVSVRLPASGRVVAGRVAVADRWWTRLRGLLGRSRLEPDEGLLLAPCRSVHMMGMRIPLDVVFLAESGEVVAAYPGLKPGGRTLWHREAWAALELAEGVLGRHQIGVGTRLAWEEAA